MFEKLIRIYGPQFLQGKIYKLVCKTSGDIYIGSTYCTLEERLTRHKNDYVSFNSKIKGVTYRTSFEILKKNNYIIELIENFPCYSRYVLHRREGLYQRNNKCVNTCIAGRTGSELSKDKGPVYRKKLYEKHKEKNKEVHNARAIDYYHKNKDKIKQKISCPICGFVGSKHHLKNHQKSSKCIKK